MLVSVDEMRALEREALRAGTSEADLMAAAGRAIADALAAWLPRTAGRRALVLVGKGNNGGDALIAARRLQEVYGVRATLYLTSERADDPLLDWPSEKTIVHGPRTDAALRAQLTAADVVIDGLHGIGARLPLEGAIASVLDIAGRHRPSTQRRVAVDVPSGVDANTGQSDERAFRADVTFATGPAKPGLFIHPGAAHAGRVVALDIGLPAERDSRTARLTATEIRKLLPLRPDDSHKGTYGKLLVIAGSARYVGAAGLTARAAVCAGAGLVTLAAPAEVKRAVSTQLPEVTYLPLQDDPAATGCLTPGHLGQLLDAVAGHDAVVLGPGLGADPGTRKLVALLAERLAAGDGEPPLLIDADALNALAAIAGGTWPHPRAARWVLTPHPGEMGRLRGVDSADVQRDRLGTARVAAAEWGQIIVLKGAPSVVAAPDGRTRLSPFANAALAVAGTGDVLSGVMGALLAQGADAFDAAVAGSFVHGLAGELWRADHGAAGLAASDLACLVPDALHRLRAG